MPGMLPVRSVSLAVLCLVAADGQTTPDARPAAIETAGVPKISRQEMARLERYQKITHTGFVDWTADGESIIVATRHHNLTQLHRVKEPDATPKLLTNGDEPVYRARTLPDGGLLFSRGRGGNESYQIYHLDPKGKEKLLTDGTSRNLFSKLSPDGRRFAFTSTRRNGRDADLYVQDLQSGQDKLIYRVDRQTWWVEDWDPEMAHAILLHYISRNESRAVILDMATDTTRPLPPELPGLAAAARVSRSDYFFGPRGKSLFFLSDARGEFRELAKTALESGKTVWLTAGIDWNVQSLEISRDRNRAAFVVNVDGFSELYLLDRLDDPDTRPTPRRLPLERCLIGNVGFSPDGSRLGLTLGQPSDSSEAHVVDLESGRLTRWTESEGADFSRMSFSEPKLIRYRSFDGRRIPAFVYPPKTKRRRHDARVPVIITIHGGPESQYRPWFSATRQFYARELGCAVIAPNVRGSAGYGKTYSLLDNGMKREDSVRDIGALLDWIRDHGSREMGLDPGRVAVTGGSYGGYMVLASLLRYGDRIRAGVDLVGISDFITFLENTSDYRRHLRRAEYGDERRVAMRRFFERISPARQIGRLRSALLLIHGKNDPRVPFSETLQVVENARATKQPVWTVYAANEGHGFSRRENRDYQQAVTVRFLVEHLLHRQ